MHKKLVHRALKLKSTRDSYEFSREISDDELEELIKLSEILNRALNIIFNEKTRWALVFRIQFINETIQFKQGIKQFNIK